MTFSGRWFVPGPVECHPDTLAAMSRPLFQHRATAGLELLARVQPRLQTLFRTSKPVLMQSGAATAMMEAAIRSGVRNRLLAVISGTFGERFADIAERCDKEVVRLRVADGEVLTPELLGQLLNGPPVDSVSLVHAETSTGTLMPVGQLIPILRRLSTDLVVIVDAVASVGATPVETDRWDVDFVLTASQKAIALPPGLAFAVASPRFLSRAADLADRGRYLDVVSLHADASSGRYPQTPPIPLLHALDEQLLRIEQEGLPLREARHRAMREMVEAWAETEPRLNIMAPPGYRADSVTALTRTDGLATGPLITRLNGIGWTLASGIGADAQHIFRIGHMGEITTTQLEPLLAAISKAL